jgi:hypothetical protein
LDTLKIVHDAANEAAVLALAARDPEARRALVRRVTVDHFAARENAEAWGAILDMHRRGLEYSGPALELVAGTKVAAHVEMILKASVGAEKNLEWHLGHLFWDAARHRASIGAVPEFLESLADPRADRERVRALARAVAQSFDGYEEERAYLHRPDALIQEEMADLANSIAGRTCYEFGIEGLDWFDPEERTKRRVMPGPAPGQMTVLTGLTGAGKSTMAANMVLGMARKKRRVLYGAWEMRGRVTLSLLALLSLGWSRADRINGTGPFRDPECCVKYEERMHAISKYVVFMGNPFFRRSEEKRASNEKNLDLLNGYLADAGCEVFVADLFKRCLATTKPDDEEFAVARMQSMLDDLQIHGILLQQQLGKEIERRPDKRPTREGIKGSGIWSEAPDTIIGVHRPSLWKSCEDNTLEAFLLKQRYGTWPLGVEFDWDPTRGSITGGRHIEYERPGEVDAVNVSAISFVTGEGKKRR